MEIILFKKSEVLNNSVLSNLNQSIKKSHTVPRRFFLRQACMEEVQEQLTWKMKIDSLVFRGLG